MEEHKFPSASILNYFIEHSSTYDINISQFGFERCMTDKRVIGPTIYNHYTLHYIVSGKGYYKMNNYVRHLSAGDVFIIFPSTLISYFPDPQEPWNYCWFDFEGIKADSFLGRAGLTPTTPVYHCPNDSLDVLFSRALEASTEATSSRDLIITSYFYRIMSHIIEQTASGASLHKKEKELHILKAVKYIDTHYNDKLSVTMLSRMLGLNPNYFSHLFKEIMGVSYSSYIVQIRLQKALIMFQQGNHTIKTVSLASGFDDPLYFSKVFKKQYGCTPKEYVQKLEKELSIPPRKM